MTVHTPKQEQPDDDLWIVLLALLLGAAAIFVAGWFVFSGSPESTLGTDPSPTVDSTDPGVATTVDSSTAYCRGWANGIAYAVFQVTGDEGFAVAYASGQIEGLTPAEAPPACDTTLAVPSDDPQTAWCRGLGEGYVAVSVAVLEMGPPPQGHDVWMAETLTGCAEAEMFATPVIPDTGVGVLPGGGGPPPADG